MKTALESGPDGAIDIHGQQVDVGLAICWQKETFPRLLWVLWDVKLRCCTAHNKRPSKASLLESGIYMLRGIYPEQLAGCCEVEDVEACRP